MCKNHTSKPTPSFKMILQACEYLFFSYKLVQSFKMPILFFPNKNKTTQISLRKKLFGGSEPLFPNSNLRRVKHNANTFFVPVFVLPANKAQLNTHKHNFKQQLNYK